LNRATPNRSISALPLIARAFSTSISTGSPWVSQPAMRVTDLPSIVW
jgi:hypothetical protein